jgi:hypothetical protein
MDKKLADEFLDELEQRAEQEFKGKVHQAFVDWYIEAEFGDVKWKFTDDVNDAGIDAIVWHPGENPKLTIIQSKYSGSICKSKLGNRAYHEFKDVVRAFRFGEESFDDLLSSARSDLRPIYRKAFAELKHSNSWAHEKKAFRLITTHLRKRGEEFREVPPRNFVYGPDALDLYTDFRQAQTPRARELTLEIDNKLTYKHGPHGVTSHLFSAKVSDFRKYLEKYDVARLLARNIRYDLAGKIGRGIRDTYEKAPANFWYFHNGLTIVCDDFLEGRDGATLVAPSVVNGGQTLYAISASSNKSSSARVPVKVIVRKGENASAIEDDDWIQKVIRGVNSQNPVRSFDLRSNEPEQVLLQARFRDYKVFYERKRGEWRSLRNEPRFRRYDRISMVVLAKVLTAVSVSDGKGVLIVKKGVDYVFGDTNYNFLFPRRSTVARRFERIYFAYRVLRLLTEYGYRDSAERRKLGHAFWNTLWILHTGIEQSVRYSEISADSIKRAFDQMERSGPFQNKARRATRDTVKEVWRVWRHERKQDPETITPNNFFKSPNGMETLRRRALPKVSSLLARVGREINSFK